MTNKVGLHVTMHKMQTQKFCFCFSGLVRESLAQSTYPDRIEKLTSG